MRTTITIDDDVASKLLPLLEKSRGKSKKVINDLLRQALGISPSKRVEIPVFKIGLKPGIDPTSLNKLSEELAVAEDLKRYQG
ncbi:MAG TPA: hypothetical protein VGL56_04665 [Fimbriimonadaceae bacterium]|jgi:hypothetical protein